MPEGAHSIVADIKARLELPLSFYSKNISYVDTIDLDLSNLEEQLSNIENDTLMGEHYTVRLNNENCFLAFCDHLFVSSHSSDLYACCKIDLKISIWKYYCSNIATIHYYVFGLSKLLLKLYKLFSKSCYLRCPTSHSTYLRASDKTVDILISKHYNLLTIHIFYSDLS